MTKKGLKLQNHHCTKPNNISKHLNSLHCICKILAFNLETRMTKNNTNHLHYCEYKKKHIGQLFFPLKTFPETRSETYYNFLVRTLPWPTLDHVLNKAVVTLCLTAILTDDSDLWEMLWLRTHWFQHKEVPHGYTHTHALAHTLTCCNAFSAHCKRLRFCKSQFKAIMVCLLKHVS